MKKRAHLLALLAAVVVLFSATLGEEGESAVKLEKRFQDIYYKYQPAIVKVEVHFPRLMEGIIGYSRSEVGTGVVISPDGYIITTCQTVKNAGSVMITLYSRDEKTALLNKEEIPAKVVGCDEVSDVALLKIKRLKMDYISIDPNVEYQVGEPIFAMGFAMGNFPAQTSFGIISALSTTQLSESTATTTFLQIDCIVYYGGQGGPVVDANGKLVGIISLLKEAEEEISGWGIHYAIPVDKIYEVVEDLKKYGEVRRPFIGGLLLKVNNYIQQRVNSPYNYGLFVALVEEPSTLKEAGIKREDVILAIDGKKISTPNDFWSVINSKKSGDTVKLKVWRKGKELEIEMTLYSKKRLDDLVKEREEKKKGEK